MLTMNQSTKKILIVLLTMMLLLAGCGKNRSSSPQASSDESAADHQEPSSSKTEISSEDHAIPGTYTVPEGWEKSEKHSTDSQIFYIEVVNIRYGSNKRRDIQGCKTMSRTRNISVSKIERKEWINNGL